MAVIPTQRRTHAADLHLQPFDPAQAERIASWIRTAEEAHWLAPKTPAPLTAEHIRRWNTPGHEPLQLVARGSSVPLAYGELNVLTLRRAQYWLGHLIVDPVHRRRGYGRALTERLLERAFSRHGAQRVCLVVFPQNRPAIACYRAVGMVDDGYEEQSLAASGRHIRLLRMAATRLQ